MRSNASPESRTLRRRFRVAVVGNPNAGKTTIFNALTGARQKVANYPGVTVEKVIGTALLGRNMVEFLDIPGLYSTQPLSVDEEVAVQAVFEESEDAPDALLCVVDASNLERNLYLFSQIAQRGLPTILVLTMVDRLADRGMAINVDSMARDLGCPVVAMVAHKDVGLADLRQRVLELQSEPMESVPQAVIDAAASVTDRYAWAKDFAERHTQSADFPRRRGTHSDWLDRTLTHRFWGLAIFAVIMYGVFQAIYTLAEPLMSLIDGAFAWIRDMIGPLAGSNEVVRSFLVDGLVTGVGSMVIFLPQILILFGLIAILEGTGYMARAAFLMDRLLGWCGLNGRAFIPLVSSFACAIPGIMAARIMPDPKSRLATILVAPLMSCSARLPVYVLLIGTFIEPAFGPFWAGVSLFGMHLLGLVIAIPTVWLLNRTVLRATRLPFVMELPPYQLPRFRDIWVAMYQRGKVFVTTAGTIIVVMSVLIWALTYFPRADAQALTAGKTFASESEKTRYIELAQRESSFLGRFGKAIEPVFLPAGFDWRITTSILAAFPARETVLPAMGILFPTSEEADELSIDLRGKLKEATWPDGRPLFTPPVAVGLMVFFALCAQCMATFATIKREANSWKWAAISFAYMTTLAYIAAVLVYQVGKVLGFTG